MFQSPLNYSTHLLLTLSIVLSYRYVLGNGEAFLHQALGLSWVHGTSSPHRSDFSSSTMKVSGPSHGRCCANNNPGPFLWLQCPIVGRSVSCIQGLTQGLWEQAGLNGKSSSRTPPPMEKSILFPISTMLYLLQKHTGLLVFMLCEVQRGWDREGKQPICGNTVFSHTAFLTFVCQKRNIPPGMKQIGPIYVPSTHKAIICCLKAPCCWKKRALLLWKAKLEGGDNYQCLTAGWRLIHCFKAGIEWASVSWYPCFPPGEKTLILQWVSVQSISSSVGVLAACSLWLLKLLLNIHYWLRRGSLRETGRQEVTGPIFALKQRNRELYS